MQGGNQASPVLYQVLALPEANRGEICADWAVSSALAGQGDWGKQGLCEFRFGCVDFSDCAE